MTSEIVKTEMSINTEGSLVRFDRELTPGTWTMIERMAPVMHRSRMFGVSSQDAAAAIMLKGFELGFSITAAFEFINVIQGKPQLAPRGALALLHNHPDIEEIKIERLEQDGKFIGFSTYMRRKGGFDYTASFTMEDAERAGLVKPGSGYDKYPENMCLWRSIGFCADVVAPDITAGLTTVMKAPEMYGVNLNAEGEIIDVQPTEPVKVTYDAPGETVTLEELLSNWTPEDIMLANNGSIPSTQEELNKVLEVLNERN